MNSPDPYWDELGVAWCAIKPGVEPTSARLRSWVRRQSLLIAIGLVIALPLGVLGVLLGLYTIVVGLHTGAWFFVTRGMTIALISVIVLYAWSMLLPVRASENANAMSDMVDLAILRTERILVAVRLSYYACTIVLVGGLVGAHIRATMGKPSQGPVYIYSAILAIIAIGAFLYGREMRQVLEKFNHVRRVLRSDTATEGGCGCTGAGVY
jgi:hypothetical protein